jgi:glutaconate CoA-transferase subunit B
LHLVYEAGVIGARPERLPLSIGDPCLVTGAGAICSMMEVFSFYLQAGRIDVGFIGGAQVDRWGNVNSTVVGEYAHPKVRLPGSGGACDIANSAGRLVIMTPHQPRRFPERVDFITSPGYPGGREGRHRAGVGGGGPALVVTDLGLLRFDERGEMVLMALHPGITVEQVRANTGWSLAIAPTLDQTPPPTTDELAALRALRRR